jgi:long-chain-fatty-acid--CoA ligase ACSBG
MLSHDNICYGANYVIQSANIQMFTDRLVSYLPLSHVVAQLLDCFSAVFCGGTVYFASPDVFKGTLTKTLSFAQPTVFFAVPRVWEKLEEKIAEKLNTLNRLRSILFRWATKVSLSHIQRKFDYQSRSKNNSMRFMGVSFWISYTLSYLEYKIADKLVLSKIKYLLGLHNARILLSGAAPIARKTQDFLMGLGFSLSEGYGMSESTGPQTLGFPNKHRVGSVGPINRFNRTEILNKDETGNGEICMYGRNVFMGYLNSPSKTQETIDSDGYLHSGDLGRIDQDGFLFITGRIKELIITAGGENVAPIPIEDAVKEELTGIVNNCMVVGDKKKFLTILITLKVSQTRITSHFLSLL